MTSRNRRISLLASNLDANGDILQDAVAPSVDLGVGVTIYDSAGLLPDGASTGDQAFVTSNQNLYIYNGSGWYSAALINATPLITSVVDSDGGVTPFDLPTDGTTALNITITATDSDGDTLTYTAVADSDFNGLATISNVDNVFTIIPFSQDSATSESGTITFRASDGVNIGQSAPQSFVLDFVSADWEDVLLSISYNDAIAYQTSSNDNSVFVDRSTNAHTVTPTGSPTQTAFHPYLDYWSVEFDEASRVNMASSLVSATVSTFTVECWVYMAEAPTVNVSSSPQPSGMVTLDGDPGSATNYNSFGVLPDRTVSLRWFDGAAKAAVTSTTLDTGRWYHIACVVNTNAIKIYIDGTEDTLTGTTTLTNRNGGTGQSGFGGNYWTDFYGYLSNLRVTHSVVYTENFTPPTENLTNVTSTVLLACQSNRLVDNSSSPIAQTITSTPILSAFNPVGQESEYAPGENKGSFVTANGDSNLLTIPHDTSLNLYSGDYTVQFWVWLDAYATSGNVISKGGNTTREWGFSLTSSTIVAYWSTNGSSSGDSVISATGLTNNLNEWIHVAFVKSGSTVKIYKNGEQVGSGTFTSIYAGSGTAKVARFMDYTGISHSLVGQIADLKLIKGTALYTANFTPPTAPVGNTNASLYLPMDNAGIFDKTGNCELTLGTYTSSSARSTGAYEMATHYGYYGQLEVELPISLGDLEFTIEWWVRQTISNQGNQIMFEAGDATDGVIARIESNDSKLQTIVSGVSGTAIGSGSTSYNVLYHHALTRESDGNFRLYRNGALIATNVNNVTIPGNTVKFGTITGYMEGMQILINNVKYTTSGYTIPTGIQGRPYQATS